MKKYETKYFKTSSREFSDEGILEEPRAEDARELGEVITNYANENNVEITFIGDIRHDKFGNNGVVVIFEKEVK